MATNPQHEPTMEEILASIRKIISEDSSEAPAAAPAAKAPEPVHEEADVLELTQELAEEPEPAPVVQAAPRPAEDVVFQSIEEKPPVSSTFHETEEPVADHGLFTDKHRKAIDDAFASIEPEAEEERRPSRMSPPSVDTSTVEAVFERAVRESFEPVLRDWLQASAGPIIERMKPVIRDWLDEKFPAMLEEAVREEVSRRSRSRR